MPAADQRVLTSLSGLDDPRARFDAVELESPRSLLALRRCGLRQEDLAAVDRAQIRLPRNGLDNPEAARDRLYAARERDRQECLRQAIQQYTRIATFGITFAESVAYPELRPYFLKEARPARDPRLRQTLSSLSSMRAAERAGRGRAETPTEAREHAQRIYQQYGRQQDAYMRTLVSALQGDASLRAKQHAAEERHASRLSQQAAQAEARARQRLQKQEQLAEAQKRWEQSHEERREEVLRRVEAQQERARERRELADTRRASLQRTAVAERDSLILRQTTELERAEQEREARTAKLQRELEEKEERFRQRQEERAQEMRARAQRNDQRLRQAQERVAKAAAAEMEARIAQLREEQERASTRHALNMTARRGETAAHVARDVERYAQSRRDAEDARQKDQERRETQLRLENLAFMERRQRQREREQAQRELSQLQKSLADDLYQRRIERIRRREEFQRGTSDYCSFRRQEGLEARRELEARRATRARELSAQLQESVQKVEEIVAPLLRDGSRGQQARELGRQIRSGDREKALAAMREAVRSQRLCRPASAEPPRSGSAAEIRRPGLVPGDDMYSLIRRAEGNGGYVTLGSGRDNGFRETRDRLHYGLPRRPVLYSATVDGGDDPRKPRPATARPHSRGPSFAYTECV